MKRPLQLIDGLIVLLSTLTLISAQFGGCPPNGGPGCGPNGPNVMSGPPMVGNPSGFGGMPMNGGPPGFGKICVR
jgi:hypothetical protein